MSWPTDMSPTALFGSGIQPVRQLYGDQQHVGAGEVYPGCGSWVGTGRGTIPGTGSEAGLTLIYGILRNYWFIRPFD